MAQYQAKAKINLALHVTGKRPDGYHLLDTLVVFCDFGDGIDVSPARDISMEIRGPFASGLKTDRDNLVLGAAYLLKKHALEAGIETPGAHIRLEKKLPVASGIGGGSADAAATLMALCDLWALDRNRIAIDAIAKQLGADVPMCLNSRPLRASGIGEELTPVELPNLHMVLVNPGVGLSTQEVFASLNLSRLSGPLPILPAKFDMKILINWLKTSQNDLQLPATITAPVINDVLDALAQYQNCRFTRMSGSGATCFGIFETEHSARTAAIDLKQRFPKWWSVASTTR